MAEHSGALAHQFDDLEQQLDCSTLGMWIFLITEIMFFGGLFTGYAIYRSTYPEAFAQASHHLDLTLGGINTVILIGSSLTMALAVRAAQLGSNKSAVNYMMATLILGLRLPGYQVLRVSPQVCRAPDSGTGVSS